MHYPIRGLALTITFLSFSGPLMGMIKPEDETTFYTPMSTDEIEEISKIPTPSSREAMNISIIIPAYNEELRIAKMLKAYDLFFAEKAKSENFSYEFIVVINGSTDGTAALIHDLQHTIPCLSCIEIEERGKGLAVAVGFTNALKRANAIIGFVDADMATPPEAFYDLITNLDNYDGIIASRYIPGAEVTPPRPPLKRWGSKLVFAPLVQILFRLQYHDTQCGAKLFKREVIEKIISSLRVKQWAFDIELLYLCRCNGFRIKELPTIWHEQEGSKLRTVRDGLQMIQTLVKLRLHSA